MNLKARVNLKTLPIVEWEHRGSEWRGFIEGVNGFSYELLVRRGLVGYTARVSVNHETTVFFAEYPDRNAAQYEAINALRRAIDMRERT